MRTELELRFTDRTPVVPPEGASRKQSAYRVVYHNESGAGGGTSEMLMKHLESLKFNSRLPKNLVLGNQVSLCAAYF